MAARALVAGPGARDQDHRAGRIEDRPEPPGELDPSIRQLHSSEYRNPSQLASGPVLVVGASHSGSDIAMELSRSRTTYLSGRSHGQLPVSVDSRAGALLWPLAKALFTRVLTR